MIRARISNLFCVTAYKTIEIDFDVFKEITVRRQSPEVSENDVLRELLNLGKATVAASPNLDNTNDSVGADWASKGVILPHGTELRTNFNGRVYVAKIDDGGILYEGKKYTTVSAAAEAITGYQTNGWTFWECKAPRKNGWITMKNLRKDK